MRSATVPRVSPRSHDERGLGRQHDREPAGPELGDEPLDRPRAPPATRAAQGRAPATSTGGGCCRPRPFASSRRCTARGAERVGGDPVDGVGGQHDEFAAADRLARVAHAGEQLRLVAAVVDGRHVASSVRGAAAGRLRAGAAVVARSRTVRSGWVAAARQPSAASSARMAAPCHSPCSMHDGAAGVREAQRGAAHLAHDVEAVRAAVERRRAGRADAPRGRAGCASSGTYGGFETTTDDGAVELGEGVREVDEGEARRCAAPTRVEVLAASRGRRRREFSAAKTRACGTSVASARAIAPLPVPRSTATGAGTPTARSASIAIWATISVSGRGTKTPGPTRSSRCRNGATPVMCCSGSRAARRCDERVQRATRLRGASASPRTTAACTAPRLSPSTWPSEQLGVDHRVGDARRGQTLGGALRGRRGVAAPAGAGESEEVGMGADQPTRGRRALLRHTRLAAGDLL